MLTLLLLLMLFLTLLVTLMLELTLLLVLTLLLLLTMMMLTMILTLMLMLVLMLPGAGCVAKPPDGRVAACAAQAEAAAGAVLQGVPLHQGALVPPHPHLVAADAVVPG